jgi:hypothetical protein
MSAADHTGVNSSYDVAWRYPSHAAGSAGSKRDARRAAYFPGVATEREKSPGTAPPGALSFPQAAFTARPYGTSSPVRSQRASSAPTLQNPTAYRHDRRP